MDCSFSYRIQTDLTTRIIYYIINILTALLAVAGNAFILSAVFKSQSLRTTSNYFLCSLAVSDFLVGAIAVPLNILRIEPSLPSSNAVHSIEKGFDFCVLQTLIASTFNLALVSIDRYIAIKCPLQYLNIFTPKFIAVNIGIVWSSSTVLAFPGLFIYGKDLMIYWLVTVLITLIVPFGIISFCYVEILKIVKTQQKTHPVVQQSGEQNGTEHVTRRVKNKKASITFAIITGVFVISFIPNLICNISYAFVYQPCSKLPEYFFWTNSVMFMSSCLNPLVYSARNREFRLVFRRLTMCLRGST